MALAWVLGVSHCSEARSPADSGLGDASSDGPLDALDDGGAGVPDGGLEVATDGSDGSHRLQELRRGCVDLPAARAGAKRARLSTAPRHLWSQIVISSVLEPKGVVASGRALAVAAGPIATFIDKSTRVMKAFSGGTLEYFINVVGDGKGSFLFGGRQFYLSSDSGEARPVGALKFGAPTNSEYGYCEVMHSKRRETFLAFCNDGGVYSLNRTGGVDWGVSPVGKNFASFMSDTIIGDYVPLYVNARELRLDAQTGEDLGGQPSLFWRGVGGTTTGILSATPSAQVLDRCGKTKFELEGAPAQSYPRIVGVPDEAILTMALGTSDSTGRLTLFSKDGALLAGPSPWGAPVAAGADGTFYVLSCINRRSEPSAQPRELIALDGNLELRWKVALPEPAGTVVGLGHQCPASGVVLSDDGIMYLVQAGDSGVILHAVQTDSPGLAETTWPVVFGDNEGSNWWD
jgi:hypothetical protein